MVLGRERSLARTRLDGRHAQRVCPTGNERENYYAGVSLRRGFDAQACFYIWRQK